MLLLVPACLHLGSHLVSWALAQLFFLMNIQVFGRKHQVVRIFFGCCLRQLINFGVLASVYVCNREHTKVVHHPLDKS
jgi:hypothetical protein